MKTKITFFLVFCFCSIGIGCGQSKTDYETGRKIVRQKIKSQFKALNIGDAIQIPYAKSFGTDETERTTLIVCSAYSDVDKPYSNNGKYECVIKGVIVEKNRRINNGYKSKGFNLVYKVTSINGCGSYPVVYNGKEVVIGQLITHNMKWFKVL